MVTGIKIVIAALLAKFTEHSTTVIKLYFSYFFSDPLKGTNVDVGIAISVTSQDASTTLKLIQDSIKSLIDTYGTSNLRYSVMTFGDRPKILAPFADKRSPEDLKKIIESVMPSSGAPDLEKALLEAKKLFDGAGARADAKKFLIVIIDNKSGNERIEIIEAAKPFITEECWVIPVAVDKEVDIDELEAITPLKNTTVEVPNTEDPDKLAEEIIDKMKERKCLFVMTVNLGYTLYLFSTNRRR